VAVLDPFRGVGTSSLGLCKFGLGLAPDDLRHALMAHLHDLRDGLHRQPFAVGRADGLVALVAQVFGGLL
jgi:hypothetical protein